MLPCPRPARSPRARTILLAFAFLLGVHATTRAQPTPAAAGPDTEQAGSLQFAFREQAWLDVLDWFARQADLSLVVNEVPPGSFTYSDTKAYTPTEALDLLNGVLSTRGFALIRRDRMLICAKLTEGLPEGLIPRVELDQLEKFGQFELVEVMFPLGKRPVEAVEQEITPLLGPYGKATSLPQTKQLLVMTTAGKMRAVNAIISSIPEPQPPKPKPEPPKPPVPTLVVYPANDVDPRAAVEMIQAMLGDVKMSVDSRTGQINTYATPPQHEVIAKLLAQMATTSDEQLKPQLQVHEIQHETPDVLLQQLQLVVPTATLTLEPNTNRLIAFAAPRDQQLLQEAIEKLQSDTPDALPQLPVIYPLREVQPESLLTMIQTMFPRAKASIDAGSQRIVVLASLPQQTAIRQFIEQLETQADDPLRRTLRLYDVTATQREQFVKNYAQMDPQLKDVRLLDAGAATRLLVLASDEEHAGLNRVLEQIRTQFAPTEKRLQYYDVTAELRQKFTTLRDQLAPDLGELQVLDDPADPRLGIVADEEQHRQIGLLLDELRRNLPTQAARLKVFSVSPTQRKRFLALQAALDPRLKSVRVIDESRPQELVVWATDEQVERIESLLTTLKQAGPGDAMQLVAYPVESGDPASVQQVLSELYPDTKILVDTESRRVMVWTTAEQHAVIAEAIRQLDAPAAAGKRRMVYYRLAEIDARDVQRLFQQLVPEMSMISDRDTNAIIAWGSDRDHELMAKTVEDFRQQAAGAGHTVVRYDCGTLDPDRVRRLLDDLVPQARFVTDPANRAIVVWGTEADHQAIDGALKQMIQVDEMSDASVRSYSLTGMTAEEIRPVLQQISPLAQFNPTQDGRRLLVWATEAHHRQIRAALDRLDQDRGDASEQQVRVYRLRHADPGSLQSALAALVPRASLSVDRDTRSLIAAAYDEDQQRIEQAVQELDQPQDEHRQTRTYRMSFRNTYGVREAIQNLVPDAIVVSDRASRMLMVTASEPDQARIASVIQQMAEAEAGTRETKVYRLESADVNTAEDALQALLADAEVDADEGTRSLVVTAGEADQARAAAVIQELDQAPATPLETRAYALPQGDVRAARDAIQALLPDATMAADRENRSLLVTARPSDQQRVAQLIEQMSQGQAAGRHTRVYRFQFGDVQAAREALESLLPAAVIAADEANRALLVTASQPEQTRVAETVVQLDRPSAQEPTLQAYAISRASVQSIADALSRMYNRNRQVAITTDEANRSLLVKAPPSEQQTIAQIVSRMENGAATGEPRTLAVYPTDANDAEALLTTLQTLLKDQQPAVELSLNERTRQLVAVATPDQHAILAEATRQLQREPFLLEVFPLQTTDPFAVELAIDRLYEEETSKPIANGDTETQQLFVRGTRQQLEEVRQLLSKMGELPAEGTASQRGIRVIPFRGDVDDAVKQLEEIWPKLRSNRIQRVRPPAAEMRLQPIDPGSESRRPERRSPPPADSPDEPPPPGDDRAAHHEPAATRTLPTAQPPASTQDSADTAPTPADPPLVIIPGPASVTLLSEDEAALSQAESLLRTLARQIPTDAASGNFAVYSLRNAGARNVTRLMTELFEQMPVTTRATLGRVSMVADERLNAVVVHGRPADRAVIAELLSVLDSSNVPDSLANAQPRIVPVAYLEAATVLEILQGIYEAQLESGGRRPEVDIPEGVSSEVAQLLQQINAAATGPLLTLQVDEVTNSIVVLAPSQLSDEVTTLIKQLDENGRHHDSRQIGIIPLRETNVGQLQEALDELLRSRRNRR